MSPKLFSNGSKNLQAYYVEKFKSRADKVLMKDVYFYFGKEKKINKIWLAVPIFYLNVLCSLLYLFELVKQGKRGSGTHF